MAETNRTLSTEQTAEVLRLIRGADSVELKLSVPDADRRSAVGALDMDPLDAQIRQVVFFDTPDLTLNTHGVVVRARRVQGRILELSTKCATAEAFEVAAQSRAFLAGHGIDLSAEQQTKTKTALEFFAAELTASSPDR